MALTEAEINKRVSDSYEVGNNVLEAVPNPLVSIRTSTYNHGPYIKQCIEGILMQKTNFAFEYIIGEDFSTDETREIVFDYARKYPNIIRVITADYNVGSKANGRRCINACRGKYIAMCEGDDYWIDPLKLQKQVDFLEGHPEYGMCYTKMRNYYQKTRKIGKEWGGDNVSFEDLLTSNTIPTLTCMLRFDLAQNYYAEINPVSRGWLMGDYPMWLWFAHKSSIAFIPEVTSIYRVLEVSASHSNNPSRHIRFILSMYEVKYFFATNFGNSNATIWHMKTIWYKLLLCILENKRDEWKKNLEEYKLLLRDDKFSPNWKQQITVHFMTLFPRFTRWIIRHYITNCALNSSK